MDTAILPASFQSRRNEHTWLFPLPESIATPPETTSSSPSGFGALVSAVPKKPVRTGLWQAVKKAQPHLSDLEVQQFLDRAAEQERDLV